MLAQSNSGALWDLLTNLAIIIGYLSPFLVIGWVSRGWLTHNFVTVEQHRRLEKQLDEFKRQIEHQEVTDAARYEKLESNYVELLRILSKGRS